MNRTPAGPARDRVAAATGALLLQLGFIAAFIHAFSSQAPPKQLERELTFFLPRLLPRPAPAAQAPRAPSASLNPPMFAPRPSVAAPALIPPAPAIQSFGQSLFGCAPEIYNNLPPDQKARCPRPGEGMAIQQAPNLMGTPSHVKDEARWANALIHEKSPVLLPGASNGGKCGSLPPPCISVVSVDGDGKVSGLLVGSADPESWPTYDVKVPAPEDFYKIEQANDAWNKSAPLPESIGVHPQ